MSEETQKEETPTEEPKEDVKENKTPTSLDKYHEENNRREELLTKETELQDRKEKLHTEQMLGGHSEAGQAPAPKETENEKWAKDAKERYAGTGMDPTLDEPK